MDDLRPITFCWDGEHMVPLEQFVPLCNRQFVVGERYRLAPEAIVESWSRNSEKRYHACMHNAWMNLPHDLGERFPTQDKLRHWILIKLHWAHEKHYVLETITDAARWAAFIQEMNEDAVCVHKGNIVTVYTAMSQKVGKMKRDDWYRSSEDVLHYAAEMCGIPYEVLYAHPSEDAA